MGIRGLGINHSTPQLRWAYCEIAGDVRVLIRKYWWTS